MKTTVLWKGSTVELEYEELATGILVYKNVLKSEWDIIARIEAALGSSETDFTWNDAKVGFGNMQSSHRLCKDFKLSNSRLVGRADEPSKDLLNLHSLIITALQQCFEHYTVRYSSHPMKYIEQVNVVRYGMGEFFKEHSDDGASYRCTISSVGYPNDDYEGGELSFPEFNIKYKPTAGDFVISPSAFIYRHSSEPVTNDKLKYSLVIMSDRNPFAHRKDNPSEWPKRIRDKYMEEELIV